MLFGMRNILVVGRASVIFLLSLMFLYTARKTNRDSSRSSQEHRKTGRHRRIASLECPHHSTIESTMHVRPVAKTPPMRASSFAVMVFFTLFCDWYKIMAGKTRERMEQHTPPT